jgi:hypothetical protein
LKRAFKNQKDISHFGLEELPVFKCHFTKSDLEIQSNPYKNINKGFEFRLVVNCVLGMYEGLGSILYI